MARLSVSLDESQADWVEEQATEFGISKGKVIRECIEGVRVGESLFTTPVNDESPLVEQRVAEVESRLEALEAAHEVIVAGSSPSQSPGDATAEGAAPAGGDQTMYGPDEEPASSASADAPTGQATVNPSPTNRVPESAGDQDDHPPASVPTDTGEGDASVSPSALDFSSDGRPAAPPRGDDSTGGDDCVSSAETAATPLDSAAPEAVRDFLETELSDDHAAAVFGCWSRLRDRGTLHQRSFETVFEEYPLEYESSDEWWDAIQANVEELPGVEPPENGGSFYRFKY